MRICLIASKVAPCEVANYEFAWHPSSVTTDDMTPYKHTSKDMKFHHYEAMYTELPSAEQQKGNVQACILPVCRATDFVQLHASARLQPDLLSIC